MPKSIFSDQPSAFPTVQTWLRVILFSEIAHLGLHTYFHIRLSSSSASLTLSLPHILIVIVNKCLCHACLSEFQVRNNTISTSSHRSRRSNFPALKYDVPILYGCMCQASVSLSLLILHSKQSNKLFNDWRQWTLLYGYIVDACELVWESLLIALEST
jgi:hypothetical protein